MLLQRKMRGEGIGQAQLVCHVFQQRFALSAKGTPKDVVTCSTRGVVVREGFTEEVAFELRLVGSLGICQEEKGIPGRQDSVNNCKVGTVTAAARCGWSSQ